MDVELNNFSFQGTRFESCAFGLRANGPVLEFEELKAVPAGALLGGSVVVEIVFAWPGMGRLTADAILRRDYPIVQAGVLVIAIIIVVVNLIVDLTYMLIDPRVRVT